MLYQSIKDHKRANGVNEGRPGAELCCVCRVHLVLPVPSAPSDQLESGWVLQNRASWPFVLNVSGASVYLCFQGPQGKDGAIGPRGPPGPMVSCDWFCRSGHVTPDELLSSSR